MGRSSSCNLLPAAAQVCSWGTECGIRSWFPDPQHFFPPVGRKFVKGCNDGSLDEDPEHTSVSGAQGTQMFLKTKTAKLFLLMLIPCRNRRQLPSAWVSDFCLSFSTSFSHKAAVLGGTQGFCWGSDPYLLYKKWKLRCCRLKPSNISGRCSSP